MASANPISNSMRQDKAFDLTDVQFGVIADIALEKFGLALPLAKKQLVLSRLSKRLRGIGLSSFDEYLALLTSPLDSANEVDNLLSSLTTNVTHFFRERHHFDTFRNDALPEMIRSAENGGRVRIWSAGCSSGQEAYSIAMTVLDLCPKAGALDIKILATDIDPEVLKVGVDGVYQSDLVPQQEQQLFDRYFETDPSGEIRAGAGIKSLISFGKINLIADWPVSGPFDVIFCRNVAIYFEKETQAQLWQRFSDKMRKGSHLFIGHSERVSNPPQHGLAPVGVTTYRKE